MMYLTRNKIYKKEEPSKDATKIFIFCEGEYDEKAYFEYFKGFSSKIDILPIPNDNGKSDPSKLKALADRYITDGTIIISSELSDKIWFVIDTDRWNEGGKIGKLHSYIHEKNKLYNGWSVAQSNPSFEIWLYYHFHSQKPEQKDVKKYTSFKKYVSSKIIGGFDNRKMPIHIMEATTNAENNFESENGQPKLFSTDIFKLAQQILVFTQEPLLKCIENLKEH